MEMKKSLSERILEADSYASMYLGNANEAEEKGDYEKAQKLMNKCQYWHDRYILLTNQSNKAAPKK